MILTVDIESRSMIGLSGGAWKYAAHPSTQILCVGVKVDDQPTRLIWTGAIPVMMFHNEMSWPEFQNLLSRADRIIAHNAEFEFCMLKGRVDARNKIPMRKNLYCTMAQAAMCALPLSLEKACEALGLPIQKDKQGNLLMKQVCAPQKDGTFIEQEDTLLRIGEYCRQDVEATWGLYNALPKIPAKELKVWQANLEINERGCKVDRQMIEEVISKETHYKAKLMTEFQKLTGGIKSPSCINATREWLAERGLKLPNLTAPLVAQHLKYDLPAPVKRCLELRRELSRTSVSKYKKMKDMMMVDDRIRGMFCYHGAGTGRWAGRGVQPHNLPRSKHNIILDLVSVIREPEYSVEAIEMIYGEGSFYPVLSSAIRSAFIANERFVCCDFGAIEARALAWLAGQESVLKAFRDNEDLYVVAASDIYNKPKSSITDDERQIGKVSILACGYGGGAGAFASMGANYGVVMSEDESQEIVTAWREANPMIVSWWKELEMAAVQAVKNPGVNVMARSVSFVMEGIFLTCLLPSGRKLYYPFANVKGKRTPWGEMKDTVFYMTVLAGRWVETDTYGGKLSENCTQAVARDVLVDCGLLRFKEYVVLHVHDENLLDTHEVSLEEIQNVMSVPPSWAETLPLDAKGWVGERYRK